MKVATMRSKMGRAARVWVGALWCAALAIAGCAGEESGAAKFDALSDGAGEGDVNGADIDAESDVPPGDGAQPDGSASDLLEPDDGEEMAEDGGAEGEEQPEPAPNFVPPPLAPPSSLTPVPIDEWRVAVVSNGSNDQVAAAIADGTFVVPEPGAAYGTFWAKDVPDENGAFFGPFGNATAYGVTRISLDKSRRLVTRADGVWQLFSGMAIAAGDIYHSKRHRSPLALQQGEQLLFFRSFRSPAKIEIQLWSTEHELVFHHGDLTTPTLLAGDTLEQWVGIPVLNLSGRSVLDARVTVQGPGIESQSLAATALPIDAVTQIAFPVRPAPGLPEGALKLTVSLASPSLQWRYETELELTVLATDTDAPLRRTRLSAVDGSVQYYGLRRPPADSPQGAGALVLSLHGAGVEAEGQAAAYSPKDWAWLVAPTNRRPFGFDWESFGRLDALEALEHAKQTLPIDPEQVYVTGHSMGGHGTWQMGTLFPGEFAVVGPSAGWASFYSYGGSPKPTGAFAWAQASSDTLNFVSNLAKRAVYIIHGTADDNVPLAEGEAMFAALDGLAEELYFHKEQGAGHWWDGDASPGADCVDWPPLFELMQSRRLDLPEVDFHFKTPGPWVSRKHDWVTILASERASAPSEVSSQSDNTSVALTTTNVRALQLHTASLKAAGYSSLSINGEPIDVDGEVHVWGPTSGKRPGLEGPGTAVFYQPFCLVYPDGQAQWHRWASWLGSVWNILGNGRACSIPLSRATPERIAGLNIVWLGVPSDALPVPPPASSQLGFGPAGIQLGGQLYADAALFAVFPAGDRLHAAWYAPPGLEEQIGRIQPFTSRLILPDYLVLRPSGVARAGFFGPEWEFDPSLASP